YDYETLKQIYENIFQTGIRFGYEIIILSDFVKFPIEDVVCIINGCIYNYGHLFKQIIVTTDRKEMDDKLVKPQIYFLQYYNKIDESIKLELQVKPSEPVS